MNIPQKLSKRRQHDLLFEPEGSNCFYYDKTYCNLPTNPSMRGVNSNFSFQLLDFTLYWTIYRMHPVVVSGISSMVAVQIRMQI